MTPQPGNVFASDVVDRGPWLFYDRNTQAAGATTSNTYFFFNTGITATKTQSDTNLQKGNTLPPPEAFSVQSVGFIFASTMLHADLAQFINNYFFNFNIGIKTFATGLLHMFPGGAGISASFAAGTGIASMLSAVNNGDPSLLVCRRFPDYPRIIPANVNFFLNVIVGSGTFALAAAVASTVTSPAYGGLNLLAVLDGILDREVQ